MTRHAAALLLLPLLAMSTATSFFSPDRTPTWTAREVVRDLDDRPHLLLRVDVHGGPFPHRAPPPFVRIQSRDGKGGVESWFAEISPDQRTVHGYFPVDVPEGGVVEVGYGADVVARAETAFSAKAVERLDRARIDPKAVVVTRQAYDEILERAGIR